MASMLAWASFSFASWSARPRRLFSRASHSASTSRPKRSSKASAVASACCCCSVHAVAIAPSLSAWSLSSVGAVSIGTPSLVIVPATEVFVGRREGERQADLGARDAVEAMFEHRVDVPIRPRADGAGAGTGRLEPQGAVALGEAQNAQARAIPLFRMRTVREDGRDERGGLRPDRACPVDEAGRRPLQMMLMGLRHVSRLRGVRAPDVAAPMSGHALASVEELDRGRGHARVDVLVDERVGDGVVMPVQLDVVVDVDAGPDSPLAVQEGLGGQRAERGLIETFEEVPTAGA